MPTQPAQAQWTVFDPTSYAAQIQEMAREMDRWMQTIQHYTAMYDKAVSLLLVRPPLLLMQPV